jgi:predicted RNA-binding Zn-ribbon protein involved in translation (DUF1610 family)
MAKEYQEKEFDDEVYEDGYYEDNYEEEELEEEGDEIEKGRKTEVKPKKSLIEAAVDEDDDEKEKDEEDEDDEDSWDKERKINVSYACEDCDYRWDDIVIKKSEFDSEEEIFETACPMCGSMSITQI